MNDTNPRLRIPPSALVRNADQRSAFGNFSLNAASFPLPSAIEHRATKEHDIYYIHRRFSGLASPIVNALIEPAAGAPANDIWTAARAALSLLSGRESPDIVKLFLAGSTRDRASDVERLAEGKHTYYGVFLPVDVPEAIELTDDYEAFLGTLGNHTRRDMRRVRRRAADAGLTFEFGPAVTTGAAERHALARDTHPEPYQARQIAAYDTFLAAQDRGFHALLRSRSGELLSCLAGLISDRAAFVFYQINQRRYPRASLSLTNRAFAIEHLISRGITELVLPGGGAGLLARTGQLRRSGELALIRRSAVPMLKSAVVAALSPRSSVAHAVQRLTARFMRAG